MTPSHTAEQSLHECLAALEDRIDPDTEAALEGDWRKFLKGHGPEGIFCPHRRRKALAGFPVLKFSQNEQLRDPALMAITQVSQCLWNLADGDGTLLMVRANYGTGILPSAFGANIFWMDESANTLPTSKPLEGGAERIRQLVDQGDPDLHAGFAGLTLEMGEHLVQWFEPYPKIRRHVKIYHPDVQSPIGVCELLWGSGLFLAAVDTPDLVHELLALITQTYIRFMREWNRIAPPPTDGFGYHWGFLHPGSIVLRNDSAMNFSPDMYREFIGPYETLALKEFGGGAMHFCGRGDHYLPQALAGGLVLAVNLTQPQYNDMEVIYRHTVDRGIPLLGMKRAEAERALSSGRALRNLIHTWELPKA